ncbi:MAG: hypothetical protein AB7V16_09490 [Vulcanibacillus sp.]
MPRPGGLSNFIRQLAGPKPRRNGINKLNRQPRNVNREPAPIQPQSDYQDRETLFGFGPDIGPEQSFGLSIFGDSAPFFETDNVIVNEGEIPFENEHQNGYSIF